LPPPALKSYVRFEVIKESGMNAQHYTAREFPDVFILLSISYALLPFSTAVYNVSPRHPAFLWLGPRTKDNFTFCILDLKISVLLKVKKGKIAPVRN
jgi:hypothetical protein